VEFSGKFMFTKLKRWQHPNKIFEFRFIFNFIQIDANYRVYTCELGNYFLGVFDGSSFASDSGFLLTGVLGFGSGATSFGFKKCLIKKLVLSVLITRNYKIPITIFWFWCCIVEWSKDCWWLTIIIIYFGKILGIIHWETLQKRHETVNFDWFIIQNFKIIQRRIGGRISAESTPSVLTDPYSPTHSLPLACKTREKCPKLIG
jgi:hypothetical protein